MLFVYVGGFISVLCVTRGGIYSRFSADRWTWSVRNSTFSGIFWRLCPRTDFHWSVFRRRGTSYLTATSHMESLLRFCGLKIEEVLVSIKKLFSCQRDDGSAHNDQADVVRRNICRPHWRQLLERKECCLFFFFSPPPRPRFYSFLHPDVTFLFPVFVRLRRTHGRSIT